MIRKFVILSFCILLLAIIAILSISSVSFKKVENNSEYRVGKVTHKLPELSYDSSYYHLTDSIKEQMLSIVTEFHDIMELNGIEYWITTGTLLGAIRHKGFIPWDDDFDVNMYVENESKLDSIDFSKYNLVLKKMPRIWKLCRNNKCLYPFVDIVPVLNMSGKLSLCLPKNTNGTYSFQVALDWPQEVFSVTDVFPLRKYDFEDISLYGPKNGEQLVKKMYGENCLHEVREGNSFKRKIPWFVNHRVGACLGLLH